MSKKLLAGIISCFAFVAVVAFAQQSTSTPDTASSTLVEPLTTELGSLPTSTLATTTPPLSPASTTPPAPPPPSPPTPPEPIEIVCGETVKNVPGDYPTIQAAVDAASEGETVRMAAGIYHEGVVMKRGICLEGAGIDETIITNSDGYGIDINSVVSAKLRNFTTKGNGKRGVNIHSSSDISLESCRLTANIDLRGAGLYVANSGNIRVDHCLIDNNHAEQTGGGISLRSDNSGAITLANITVANNTAEGESGLWAASPVTIKNSIFWGNTGTENSIDVRDYCFECSNIAVSYSIIESYHDGRQDGLPTGQTLSSVYPHLKDNFQLWFYSRAVDAGDPSSPQDPDGTRADLGFMPLDWVTFNQPAVVSSTPPTN